LGRSCGDEWRWVWLDVVSANNSITIECANRMISDQGNLIGRSRQNFLDLNFFSEFEEFQRLLRDLR